MNPLIPVIIAVATIYFMYNMIRDYRVMTRLARVEQSKILQRRKSKEIFDARFELMRFYHENRWTMNPQELDRQLNDRRMNIQSLIDS